LEQQYRAIFSTYAQIIAQRAQREAAAQQLEARNKQFQAGKGTLDFLLEAQRLWADALRAEYQAIADYNNAMARFEYAKGTIMQRDNIVIAEGGLPQCAQVRAVEHERERSSALVLRERAKAVTVPCCRVEGGTLMGLPDLPPSSAPSVPALFEGQASLDKVPDRLPAVPASGAKAVGGVGDDAGRSESHTSDASGLRGLTPPAQGKAVPPIIGAPTAAGRAPTAEETKGLGAYQIPTVAEATTSVSASAPKAEATTSAPSPTLKVATPASASQPAVPEEPVQWNHPERFQRARWRESLGDSAAK